MAIRICITILGESDITQLAFLRETHKCRNFLFLHVHCNNDLRKHISHATKKAELFKTSH